MPSEPRSRPSSEPFGFVRTKDGRVLIDRGGRTVVTIRGSAAARLLEAVDGADDEEAVQRLLARATGDYRRGNERRAGRDHPRSG